MLFRFKSTLTDFLVDEQLPYKLLTQGSHFFVHIEKQATTTMEIIDHLRRTLALPKNLIGYAGLKDKKGITRQRFSFDAQAMKKRMQVKYREDILLKSLKQVCTVLDTGRQSKQLSLRDDFYNNFTVILRATKKLSQKEKELTATTLQALLQTPLPNYFGTQRFGINGRNVKEAEAMLIGKRADIVGFDRKFKLQALASHLFNMTLKTRIEKNPDGLMDGDFLEIEQQLYQYHNGNLYLQNKPRRLELELQPTDELQPAGQKEKKEFFVQGNITTDSKPFAKDMKYSIMLPLLGYNSLIPQQTTDMGRYYHLFLRRQHINETSWKLFQELEIFGIMRAVYISCIKPQWKRIGDDIQMSFWLPAGSYASVVVDMLTEQLNEKIEGVESWKEEKETKESKGEKGKFKRFSNNKVKKETTTETWKDIWIWLTASRKKTHRKGLNS